LIRPWRSALVESAELPQAYPKSEREDLSHDEIKQLKRLVEEFE